MLMLPHPHPNETIYSLCARFCDRMNIPTHYHYKLMLFGRNHKKLSHILPQGLNHLAQYMPLCSVDDLIDKHTAFPFFTPFMTNKRRHQLREQIRDGGNQGVTIIGNTGVSSKFVKYCSQCMSEQHDVGEMYWNRLHQLARIDVCAIHLCSLNETTIEVGIDSKFISAETYFADLPLINEIEGDKAVANNLEVFLAQCVKQLMEGRFSAEILKQRYLVIMAEQGYATYGGTLNTKTLTGAFLQRYSIEQLTKYGWQIELGSRNQLTQLIQSNKTKSPIHHLMMFHFVGYNVDRFFGRSIEFQPFGTGEWPCLNRVCEHYEDEVIKKVAVGFTRSKRFRPLGTFICPECGFCYSRAGMDKDSGDRTRIGIIRAYGEVWDNQLIHLWADLNGNVKAIMCEMQASREAITANAGRLGLLSGAAESPAKRYGAIPTDENIANYRQQWMKTLHENPNIPSTQLRIDHAGIFTWLMRHDYRWLTSNTPDSHRGKSKQVDWQARDEELNVQVERAIESIGSLLPPKRITNQSIAEWLGYSRAFKSRDLEKMPLTADKIRSEAESHEQFAIRRIKYHAAQLQTRSSKFSESDLIKAAGISRAIQTNPVLDTIKEIVKANAPP